MVFWSQFWHQERFAICSSHLPDLAGSMVYLAFNVIDIVDQCSVRSAGAFTRSIGYRAPEYLGSARVDDDHGHRRVSVSQAHKLTSNHVAC